MNAIGGYFELELRNTGTLYHEDAAALNSGRNALEYILTAGPRYDKVYLPYYTCDVMLQTLKRLNYTVRFYSLDSDLLPQIEGVGGSDVLVYVNYFGIVNSNVRLVYRKYRNVIIDNAQAFFIKPLKNVPTLYSPRKFFGIPDGGFAYPKGLVESRLNRDKSIGRLGHLIKRTEDGPEAGYEAFKKNDATLKRVPMRRMSSITERLLRNIDFNESMRRRNANFQFLHRSLRKLNELSSLIEADELRGPMAYPFLKKGNAKRRSHLHSQKIYVATYWPNVYKWSRKGSREFYMADNLLPLPVDQRYSLTEMATILEALS